MNEKGKEKLEPFVKNRDATVDEFVKAAKKRPLTECELSDDAIEQVAGGAWDKIDPPTKHFSRPKPPGAST